VCVPCPNCFTFVVSNRAPEFPALKSLESDPTKYPLFERARRTEVVVAPGEVLWVPGGTPHFVENLEDSVAYAGNYIDASNYDKVCIIRERCSAGNQK